MKIKNIALIPLDPSLRWDVGGMIMLGRGRYDYAGTWAVRFHGNKGDVVTPGWNNGGYELGYGQAC